MPSDSETKARLANIDTKIRAGRYDYLDSDDRDDLGWALDQLSDAQARIEELEEQNDVLISPRLEAAHERIEEQEAQIAELTQALDEARLPACPTRLGPCEVCEMSEHCMGCGFDRESCICQPKLEALRLSQEEPPQTAEAQIAELMRERDERIERHEATLRDIALVEVELEAAEAEVQALRQGIARMRQVVDRQAEDDGLWFVAERVTEAYLQEALRALHSAIESELFGPARPPGGEVIK